MDSGILFGRLHPMVLHFPITCLVLVVAFEWLALVRRTPAFGPATRGLLAVGVLTGVLAVLTGLQFSEESTFEDERAALYERHEICGFVAVGTAAAALVAGIVHTKRPSSAPRAVYLLLVHVAAAAVGVGAHAGALLHWGTDFLTR